MSKSDKAPKKPCARVNIKEEELVFLCEWSECQEQFNTIRDFLKHVGNHISEFFNSAQNQGNCFSCHWKDCGSQILGNAHNFNRHVYFHAFHVKLKCIGEVLMKRSPHPECCLDKQSRNWIPELPENLQCGWKSCGVISDNPLVFYNHVTDHIEEYGIGNNVKGGCQCQWTDCDGRFKSKYKLREHLRSHTQEKVVACPTCGGLFANRTKFFDHLTRQKESSLYCYQCSHCNKRFATERLLRDHMRHHVNHYKCPFCDMTTPAPSCLRAHIRYRHTLEKPYRCAHCDHGAKSATDLRRHLESHNTESGFVCHMEKCRYKAKTYISLANHFKKVHQIQDVARHTCHICEKKFTRGWQLTRHLKKKHKFKWPPGHSKFRYKAHDDGSLRLQTVRYESIEVSEQILDQEEHVHMEVDDLSAPGTSGSPQSPETQEADGDENQENDHPTSTMSVHDVSNFESNLDTRVSQNTLQPVTSLASHPNPVVQVTRSVTGLSEDSNSSWKEPLLSMPDFSFCVKREVTDVGTPSTCTQSSNSGSLSSFQNSQNVSRASENISSSMQTVTEQQDYVQQLSGDPGPENPSINFTFISNPDEGESRIQNLCLDNNGILVFRSETNNAHDVKGQITPTKGDNYDTDAYNLEMLGDVALQGENYSPRFVNL